MARKEWKRKLPGRDLGVFVMSLLLAFGIWLIHNLSLNYSETLSVPVIAECEIEGHSNVSANSSTVAARCRTSGFAILKGRHKAKKDAIHVKFDRGDLHESQNDYFQISSAELGNYVSDIFGDGVQLESFLSETVSFRFPSENHKKVAVQAVTTVSFRPQYTALGPIHLSPDSVTVYGEPYQLEQVSNVFTKSIDLINLKSNAHGSVKIEPVQGIRMSDSEVGYTMEVTRFIEVTTQVSITTKNVPHGISLSVYPKTAKVSYKCQFPMINDPSDRVSFYIDYEDFEKSITGRCIAKPSRIPEGVIEYSIEPEVFQCMEESAR
jgi:hypothetical protein